MFSQLLFSLRIRKFRLMMNPVIIDVSKLAYDICCLLLVMIITMHKFVRFLPIILSISRYDFACELQLFLRIRVI